jgi:hypothetical protein
MLINIIYNMPNWLLALIIVILVVLISVLGLTIVRKVFKRKSLEMDNEIVIGLGHQAGVIFAIVVGFVAITVLGAFDKAENTAEGEAKETFAIWLDSRAYPAEFEIQVRDAVENYLHVLIQDEWPKQRQGEISLSGDRSLENLYRLLIDYSPTSRAQQAVHDQILNKVNKIFDDRNSREFINLHGLEPTVYYEIILSILVVLGFAWSFSPKNPKSHYILTIMLGIGIGLVFFLIVLFDNPFRGEVSVQSTPYQNALQHIQRLKIEQPTSKGI